MSDAEDSPQETFLSHLVELRSRLLKSIVVVLVVFVAMVPFAKEIYALVAKPLMNALPPGATMIATDVTGTFLVPLKVTLLAAFLVSLPWVLWQIWAFVAPGLYKHEQQLALPLIVSSVLLFFTGMAFAYFVVFPWIFELLRQLHARRRADDDRHRQVPVVRAGDVRSRSASTFEIPVVVVRAGADGHRAAVASCASCAAT